MMRGDLVPLFEVLLLLLLPAGSKERTPLLEQILVFLRSDACLLAQLAQQCATLQHVLCCAAAAATGEAKRAQAGRVVAHQLKVPLPLHPLTPPHTHTPLSPVPHYTPYALWTPLRPDTPYKVLASRLKQFLSRAAWADVRPARRHMTSLLEALHDAAQLLGADQRPDKAEEHTARMLGAVGRKVRALHLVLADSAAGSCALVAEHIGQVWSMTTDVKVPVALQPPPLRERIINVPKELARHKHIHTYPADVAREAVLLQYVVDTRLDETLQRALLGLCSEAALRGNPFHAIIGHMKAPPAPHLPLTHTPHTQASHTLTHTPHAYSPYPSPPRPHTPLTHPSHTPHTPLALSLRIRRRRSASSSCARLTRHSSRPWSTRPSSSTRASTWRACRSRRATPARATRAPRPRTGVGVPQRIASATVAERGAAASAAARGAARRRACCNAATRPMKMTTRTTTTTTRGCTACMAALWW